MHILIASDHAGYDLKEALKPLLVAKGFEVEDMGAFSKNMDDDYPDMVAPLVAKVAQNKGFFGIILGGSGQGEAVVANRTRGVRAAVYYGGPLDIVTLSREHNDANILSLGARFLSVEEAVAAVTLWLDTAFSSDERHVRRITKIDHD